MSLYKQRGSNVWWYEFHFAGVRYRESSKSTSKTVAKEAERARRRQVEEVFNGIKKREMPKTALPHNLWAMRGVEVEMEAASPRQVA